MEVKKLQIYLLSCPCTSHEALHSIRLLAGIAHRYSDLLQAKMVWGSDPSGSEMFCTYPDRTRGPRSLFYSEYRPRCGVTG